MANGFIKLGDKEVSARSTGLTSTVYRHLFSQDIEQQMTDAKNKKLSGGESLNMFRQLAFVMIWQAKDRDVKTSEAMKALRIEDYYDWLDEEVETIEVLTQDFIASVTQMWVNNSVSLVDLKNK